jgi:hypothetical protein
MVAVVWHNFIIYIPGNGASAIRCFTHIEFLESRRAKENAGQSPSGRGGLI